MTANIFLALVPFFILILFYFFWRINQLEKYLIQRREEEEKEIQHSNRNFYKMPAEQELFLRCFRMPQKGELSKPYTTTDLFNYLQKHYPAAMRGVTPNRLGRMMVALGIQRIHTEYGNVYRLVKLKDSSAA